MNAFQWIACTTLAVVLLRDILPRRRAPLAWTIRVARSIIWGVAIVAIAQPRLVTRFANLLGIGRGADIVLYVLALAFVAVTFHLYARQIRLHRQLTALASHIALGEPQLGGAAPADRKPTVARRVS